MTVKAESASLTWAEVRDKIHQIDGDYVCSYPMAADLHKLLYGTAPTELWLRSKWTEREVAVLHKLNGPYGEALYKMLKAGRG